MIAKVVYNYVVRALAMIAGDPGSIPGHATNFSNFSEGIGKPL